MTGDEPQDGIDGPYAAPLKIPGETVLSDWIDYNGHMNVTYYLLSFDHAVDRFLGDILGVGEAFTSVAGQGSYALQSNIHYLGELLEGTAFDFSLLLIDCDAKRMHMMVEMNNLNTGTVAATCEQLLMNVDLTTRRSTPYPDWAQARMALMRANHADAPRPPQFAQPLGLRRRGG